MALRSVHAQRRHERARPWPGFRRPYTPPPAPRPGARPTAAPDPGRRRAAAACGGALHRRERQARQELGARPAASGRGRGEPVRVRRRQWDGPPNVRAMERPAADRSAGAVPAPTIRGAGVPGSAVADVVGERVGLAVRERMPLWLQSRCGLEKRSVAPSAYCSSRRWSSRHSTSGAAVRSRCGHRRWCGRRRPTGSPAPGREPVRGARRFGRVPSSDAARVPTGVASSWTSAARCAGRDCSGCRPDHASRTPCVAGGVRPGTDTGGLNRARLLVDGEQIVVGAPAPVPGVGAEAGAAGPGTGASVAGAAPGTSVSLSTATVDQLDALPESAPSRTAHRRLPRPARGIPLGGRTPRGQRHRRAALRRPAEPRTTMSAPQTGPERTAARPRSDRPAARSPPAAGWGTRTPGRRALRTCAWWRRARCLGRAAWALDAPTAWVIGVCGRLPGDGGWAVGDAATGGAGRRT